MAKRPRRVGDLSIALITLAWIAGASGAGYLVTHAAPAPASAEVRSAPAAITGSPLVKVQAVSHHRTRRLTGVVRSM